MRSPYHFQYEPISPHHLLGTYGLIGKTLAKRCFYSFKISTYSTIGDAVLVALSCPRRPRAWWSPRQRLSRRAPVFFTAKGLLSTHLRPCSKDRLTAVVRHDQTRSGVRGAFVVGKYNLQNDGKDCAWWICDSFFAPRPWIYGIQYRHGPPVHMSRPAPQKARKNARGTKHYAQLKGNKKNLVGFFAPFWGQGVV
jgi:hypothetical protein